MIDRLWLNRGQLIIRDRLRSWLCNGYPAQPDTIALVAGYVSIRGLMRIEAELRNALDQGTEVRLLLAVTQDERASVTLSDPFIDVAQVLRRRLARDVELLRAELSGIPMIEEAALRLLGLAHVLRRPLFGCRRHETAFVHSKVMTQHGNRVKPTAVIGSANLTLGGMERNEECCAQLPDGNAAEAVEYATALWHESTDFDLAGVIEELFANYPHPLVFLRMLFELFGQDVNATNKLSLTDWQRDGVARALAIADQYGGALIADDVGVGKTFEAAEIIRRVVEQGGHVLVVSPANLVPMWTSRLAGWNLPADVVSYHSLPAAVRAVVDADETTFPYQLVVLDEAHWLRNPTTWREALRTALALADTHPPMVIALTATPIQNRGQDIVEILTLCLPRMSVVERRRLAERCRKADQLNNHELSGLHDQLETMTVRRTRPFIRDNYITSELNFPQQRAEELRYALPSVLRRLVRDVLAALDADHEDLPPDAVADLHTLAPGHAPPAALTMAAYHLQDYQQQGSGTRGGLDWTHLIKCLLCKRLESSVAALASTLDAMRTRCSTVLDDLAHGTVRLPGRPRTAATPYDTAWDDTLDERALAELETDHAVVHDPRNHLVEYPADQFVVDELRRDLLADMTILTNLRDRARSLITRDPKFPVLADVLAKIACDMHGPKVVIFTSSRITGDRITTWLEQTQTDPSLAAYRGRIASLARIQRPSEQQIQHTTADFAPQATATTPGSLGGRHHPQNRYDLLVCTDMLAEGINLQQSAFVVHFDLPWNPMILGQRAGRVDRLGSPYERITCYSVFPDRGLDAQLHLLNRLYGKISVAAAAVGVPTPIIPYATVHPRNFTTVTHTPEQPDSVFPAFDRDIYRVMLGNALRTPVIGDAIRRFPRKAGGIAGTGDLRGYVFCFRIHTDARQKAMLCTIFTNGASLLGQTACLQAAACDLSTWLTRATRNPDHATAPQSQLPEQILQHLWPALTQARKKVAEANNIADANSDDQITLVTWLALTNQAAPGTAPPTKIA